MRYLSGSELEALQSANPDFASFIENFLTIETNDSMFRVTMANADVWGIGNNLNDAINDFFHEWQP